MPSGSLIDVFVAICHHAPVTAFERIKCVAFFVSSNTLCGCVCCDFGCGIITDARPLKSPDRLFPISRKPKKTLELYYLLNVLQNYTETDGWRRRRRRGELEEDNAPGCSSAPTPNSNIRNMDDITAKSRKDEEVRRSPQKLSPPPCLVSTWRRIGQGGGSNF